LKASADVLSVIVIILALALRPRVDV